MYMYIGFHNTYLQNFPSAAILKLYILSKNYIQSDGKQRILGHEVIEMFFVVLACSIFTKLFNKVLSKHPV